MVLTDVFLDEMAKAMNGESYTVGSDVAFSNDIIVPDATDTALPSEFDRSSTTGSRTGNKVSFTAIRSGAIASVGGDTVNSIGLLTASSGGNLLSEATVPSIVHTQTFDLEVDWQITIERK